MHSASCVWDALRLRHRVHSNLARGVCLHQELRFPTDTLISLDLRQAATLDTSSLQLVFTDLRSGAVRRCPLPRPPGLAYQIGLWSWGGATLAIPYGGGHMAGPAVDSGVLLVDAALCTLKDVRLLGMQPGAHVCQPLVSRWSSTGCLLVQLRCSGGLPTLFVLGADGQLLRRIAAPHASCNFQRECWSPDGRRAVLSKEAHAVQFVRESLWVWDVTSDSQPLAVQVSQWVCPVSGDNYV